MGYRLDLDELDEDKLRLELTKRAEARANGLCDYCCRPSGTTPCKFPVRHAIAKPNPKCQTCGKLVREGMLYCAGLSECWKKGEGVP